VAIRRRPFPAEWRAIIAKNVPYIACLTSEDREELAGHIQVDTAQPIQPSSLLSPPRRSSKSHASFAQNNHSSIPNCSSFSAKIRLRSTPDDGTDKFPSSHSLQ
jgi:hypothetical protein